MKRGSAALTSREVAINRRRERKFEKHDIEIREGFIYLRGKAIAGGRLITSRSLLKHSHQICRNLERGRPPIDGRRNRSDYEREQRERVEAEAAAREARAAAAAREEEYTKPPTRRGKKRGSK